MGTEDLLIVAGEASGDLHAARLLSALRELRPDVRAFGLGGEELDAAGFDRLAHASEISVVGIVEALSILRRARQIFAELLDEVDRRRPQTAVLVDFAEFNMRMARALTQRGVRVVYYISPQIWAWRRGRVKAIERTVDRMLVVLPFEVDFYREHGVEAVHVGHPLVDEVPELPQVWESETSLPETYHVSLLPGSRRSELDVILPILLETARLLDQRLAVRFSLIRASTIPSATLEETARGAGIDVEVVTHDRLATVAGSHLALSKAGTAALEVGLLETPMVVTHRVNAFSAFLGRRLVKLPHASLVNLILGREAVPELLQHRARPELIAAEALSLLTDRARVDEMRRSLAPIRELIGPPGGSRQAAREVDAVMAADGRP